MTSEPPPPAYNEKMTHGHPPMGYPPAAGPPPPIQYQQGNINQRNRIKLPSFNFLSTKKI